MTIDTKNSIKMIVSALKNKEKRKQERGVERIETDSKLKEEEEPKELSDCWDWASAIAEG